MGIHLGWVLCFFVVIDKKYPNVSLFFFFKRGVFFRSSTKRNHIIGLSSDLKSSVLEYIPFVNYVYCFQVWSVFRDVCRFWRVHAKCPRLKRSGSDTPGEPGVSPEPVPNGPLSLPCPPIARPAISPILLLGNGLIGILKLFWILMFFFRLLVIKVGF